MTTWFKHEESDVVWWKSNRDSVGEMIFSFDKKKEFNFWQDYPKNRGLSLTKKMKF